MRERRIPFVFLCLLAAVFFTESVRADVVRGTVVVKIGDTPPAAGGDYVSVINSPFTSGRGSLGFVGAVERLGGTDYFVWYDDGPVWFNSNSTGLDGGETFMGVGDDGKYIYSPSDNGNDSVRTQDGLLLRENEASPGVPGMFVKFTSRPSMLPDGTVYWVSGWTDVQDGSTLGRILYRSGDTVTPGITTVFKSGDNVGGFIIGSSSGIDFDYMISDNDLHHIHALFMDTGSTANDGFVYVDGSLVARETGPAAGGESGENWDNFDLVSINNSGNYLFSGDTDGSVLTDEFIAYNGTIIIREGQILDGIALTSTSSVQGLAINNRNQAVHLWQVSGTDEHLFYANNAARLNDSVKVLSIGDTLDVDGDGSGDYTVTDFNATNSMRYNAWLAEDGYLFVHVDIDDGGGPKDAIIRISLPAGRANPGIPILLLDDGAP
jgi:hypothetical protein